MATKKRRTLDNNKDNTVSSTQNNVESSDTSMSPGNQTDDNIEEKRIRTRTHSYNTRSQAQIFTLLASTGTLINDEVDHAMNKTLRKAADYAEIKQILDFKTMKFLKHISHREKSIHNKILPAHFVRTVKYSKGIYLKHKSRLTAGGNHEQGVQDVEKSSPTVSFETIMMQLAIAVNKNHKISSIDYQAAFLNALTPSGKKHVIRLNKNEAQIVCAINPSLTEYVQDDGTMIAQLEKSLYGLREAGKLWFDMLSSALYELGFTSCVYEQTLFRRGDNEIITVHVDDLLLTYTDDLGHELMQYFESRKIPLKLNHLTETEPLEHLGVVIELMPDKTLTLSQHHYIKSYILDEYKPEKEYITPAIHTEHNDDQIQSLPVDKSKYLQKLMRIYYVAARTRPDLLAAISYASTVAQPTEYDNHKLDRIIGYLKGTANLKMHITKTDLDLFGYFDASFAIHPDMKSHSGKVIYLGEIPIWYKSTKQKSNTKSSAHAELNTLYEGLDILLWCRAILNFLLPEFDNQKPTTVYQDNISTIRIAEMGRAATKSNSRYINCRTYWIKDLIETHMIDVRYKQSDQMIADALASIRCGSDFTNFRHKMQIYRLEQFYQ